HGLELAEQRDADVVLLEVEHHALDLLAALPLELEQLAGHGAVQAVHARDAVACGQDGAGLLVLDLLVVVLDLLADDVADLCGADVHGWSSSLLAELVAERAELSANGAVVNGVAELGDDAAEQRGVLL